MDKKRRLFVTDIAKATGLSASVIRQFADEGKIQCQRDWNGWRIFPESAIAEVKKLAGIMNGKAVDEKDNIHTGAESR